MVSLLAAVPRSLRRFPVGTATPTTIRQRKILRVPPFVSTYDGGGLRLHSSAAAAAPTAPAQEQNNDTDRIPRTLYRQLLRWCQAEDRQGIPLWYYVPPIHVRAPEQVDARRTESLFAADDDGDDGVARRARRLLPSKTELKSNSLTVPVHSSQALGSFFQAIFRLNAERSEPEQQEYRKQRISVAFEALRSLNELSEGGGGSSSQSPLERLDRRRKAHLDRTGVRFRIGQVVHHPEDRWRGVVVGWDRIDAADERPRTASSLTTKDYASRASEPDETTTTTTTTIRYDVLLDEGDLYMAGSSSEWISAVESELEPVLDGDLARVRNHSLSEYFTRFDRATRIFVPNDHKAYKYPLDVLDDDGVDVRTTIAKALTEPERKLCEGVVTATQQFARQLQQYTSEVDETETVATAAGSAPHGDSDENNQRGLLVNVRSRLAALVEGDVLPMRYRLSSEQYSPAVSAAHHVRGLLNLSLEIFDVMFHRRKSMETKHTIKFNLGDIVIHKKYSFRGVVVAWDPKPAIDVTRWDGLKHIEAPMELPFYHVIPDPGDCVAAFGGERPMRYVCEDNLEACPEDRCLIDVHLEPDWHRSPSGRSYVPPDELRFKYGETLDDGGATERGMVRIQEALNGWQLEARQSNSSDPITSLLSMETMQELLQIVDTIGDAIAVEDMIKEMRKSSSCLDLRWRLDAGITALMSEKRDEALEMYQSVIDKDPEFPEALNKIATCEFMIGKVDESIQHTKRVLELDPTHFGALNGLGLIYFKQGKFEQAIECFRESIAIDPWSPVSSKLSLTMDLVNRPAEPASES